MTQNFSDKELLQWAKEAMLAKNYDLAIDYTNKMQNKGIALKAHLLIIEHEMAEFELNLLGA
jgi:hypothetical protein